MSQAIEVAQLLLNLNSLIVPFRLDEYEIFISATIAIVLSSPDYQNSEYLLPDADPAIYRAKALGESSYQVFDTAIHTLPCPQAIIVRN